MDKLLLVLLFSSLYEEVNSSGREKEFTLKKKGKKESLSLLHVIVVMS